MKYWAKPRFVWAAWVSYGLLFSAIQLIGSSTLVRDFAYASEILQRQWAPIYRLRNPPAYEWLLWLVQLVVGDGIISHVVLRYGIIISIGILIYHLMRQVRCAAPMAAAMSFSLVTFYWFAFDFHQRVTHSLPMMVAGLVAWLLILKFLEKPTSVKAFLFGLALGIGFVSKYNFTIFILALALGMALTERTRWIFFDQRMLLAPVGAALACAPFAIGVLDASRGLEQVFYQTLVLDPGDPYWVRLGLGLSRLAYAVLAFFAPWGLFVAFAAWRSRNKDAELENRTDWRGLLAIRITTAALLICLSGVIVFGVTNVYFRYLYPVFLLAPIGAGAWLVQRVDTERFARLMVILATICCGVSLFARVAMFYTHDIPRRMDEGHLLPFAALAERLTAYNLADADIVTHKRLDAGNLISLLPRAQVHAIYRDRILPPQSWRTPGRVCVALWRNKYRLSSERPRPMRIPRIFRLLMPPGAELQIEKLDIDWRRPLVGAPRTTTWYLLRGPAAQSICRARFPVKLKR